MILHSIPQNCTKLRKQKGEMILHSIPENCIKLRKQNGEMILHSIPENCIKLRKQNGQYFRNLTQHIKYRYNMLFSGWRSKDNGDKKDISAKNAQKIQKPHCLFCFSHIQWSLSTLPGKITIVVRTPYAIDAVITHMITCRKGIFCNIPRRERNLSPMIQII